MGVAVLAGMDRVADNGTSVPGAVCTILMQSCRPGSFLKGAIELPRGLTWADLRLISTLEAI